MPTQNPPHLDRQSAVIPGSKQRATTESAFCLWLFIQRFPPSCLDFLLWIWAEVSFVPCSRCVGSTERTTMPELFEKEPQPSSASVSFAAAVQLIPPTERFLMNLASLWLPNANTRSYHTARSKALIGCYSIFSCWLQREREHRVSLCGAADMTSSVLAALLRNSN